MTALFLLELIPRPLLVTLPRFYLLVAFGNPVNLGLHGDNAKTVVLQHSAGAWLGVSFAGSVLETVH